MNASPADGFPRDTDVAVVYAHLLDAPPRVTEACPRLPVALDDVIGTALANGRMILRCIEKRSGVKRLGSRLVRHSFGQGMARARATIADIENVLGHESHKM